MRDALVDARFVTRINRFRVRAELGDGLADAHLPNPGRLRELLLPGVSLRLVPIAGASRSTGFDVLAVRRSGEWVCLDTRLANTAVADALSARSLPEFSGYRVVRPEARRHDSRFDFVLEEPGRCWLEVKMCSLVVGDRGLFPDAPTLRGTKHVRELASLVRHGVRAALLFVVVRHASRFSPNDVTDPPFGAALRAAIDAGVEVSARRAQLRGRRLVLGTRVPIDL